MDRDRAKNYHFFRSWAMPLGPRTQREIEGFMNECEKHHRRWELQLHQGCVVITAVETVIEFDGEEDK